MERIVHNAINISKPKPTEINISKPTPNLVTEAIVIEKPRHIEVTVAKGSVGINGRNGIDGRNGADGINGRDGRDGLDGMDGRNGKDGGVFVPRVVDNSITWNYETTVTEYPSSINMLAGIDSITNSEIYSIVNGD